MITRIPFDWNDPAQVAVIDSYKISGYYPPGFNFYGMDIEHPSKKGFKLEVKPHGNEPVNWVSGILENKDNHYAAFVDSVKENPKYKL